MSSAAVSGRSVLASVETSRLDGAKRMAMHHKRGPEALLHFRRVIAVDDAEPNLDGAQVASPTARRSFDKNDRRCR